MKKPVEKQLLLLLLCMQYVLSTITVKTKLVNICIIHVWCKKIWTNISALKHHVRRCLNTA